MQMEARECLPALQTQPSTQNSSRFFFPACALCFTQAPPVFPQFFSTALHFGKNPQQDTILQSLANKGKLLGKRNRQRQLQTPARSSNWGRDDSFQPPSTFSRLLNSKITGNSWPRPTSDLKHIPQTEQGKNSKGIEKQRPRLRTSSWGSDAHLIHCGTYWSLQHHLQHLGVCRVLVGGKSQFLCFLLHVLDGNFDGGQNDLSKKPEEDFCYGRAWQPSGTKQPDLQEHWVG